jgi:transcriptional regulator with XRE-family HTH domain
MSRGRNAVKEDHHCGIEASSGHKLHTDELHSRGAKRIMPSKRAPRKKADPAAPAFFSKQPGRGSIAARIRSLRLRKGITLEDLSELTQLDRGYLSRIERGHKTPSIATLMKVGEALGVQMSHLFGETVEPGAIKVVRHGERTPLHHEGAHSGEAFYLIMPQSESSRVSMGLLQPTAVSSIGAADHAGEEIIYVLDGQAEVSFADRKVVLGAGDCVRFDGHLKHAIRKVGHARARALVIVVQDPAKASRAT